MRSRQFHPCGNLQHASLPDDPIDLDETIKASAHHAEWCARGAGHGRVAEHLHAYGQKCGGQIGPVRQVERLAVETDADLRGLFQFKKRRSGLH